MKRDGFCLSLWQHETPQYSNKASHMSDGRIPTHIFDVVIIGGGVTGVTTALQLQKAGKKCILLEAQNLGFGTTGGTTAHLNTILDTPYHQIINDFGKDGAQQVADGARNALELIRRNIEEYKIDCDYKDAKGYMYAQTDSQAEELEKILKGSQEVGEHIEYSDTVPVPIPFQKAVVFDKQAQFNPIKYLYGIAEAFEHAGGIIMQECRATDVTSVDGIATVTTNKTEVKARNVIYATHIPPGVNVLHFTCAPYRSYTLAVKLSDKNYPEGLAYDMYDPYRYYRTQVIEGEKYLIAGGEDHKTAHEINTEKCFRELEVYVRQFFNVESIAFKWSSQYFEPADGLPYIGHLPGNPENVYVATGFSGNGFTFGTISAMVLSDIICNGKSEYQDLYSPSRIKPVAGFENVVKESADVVGSLIVGWLQTDKLNAMVDLARGDGKVVNYEGKKVGVYKDEVGKLYAVNPACPHIACAVSWNTAEKTWDCPCHGSRFSYTGTMVTGPSRKDLQQIDLRKDG